MKVLTVCLSDAGYKRLARRSRETGLSIGDIPESAVEEDALRYERGRIVAEALGPRPVHPDWLGGAK